jgi:hypothetical protein
MKINFLNATTRFAVYSHTVQYGEMQSIVYVGVCRLSDIGNPPDARKNKKWVKMVKSQHLGDFTISLIGNCATRKEAEKLQELILNQKQILPYCNVPDSEKQESPFAVRCLTTKKEFKTAKEAAAFYGIHITILSNHLRQKRGYEKPISGLIFKWVTT